MEYMLRTREFCDRKQQNINRNLYSLVYVLYLFDKAATLNCDVTNGTNIYVFPFCSSVAG